MDNEITYEQAREMSILTWTMRAEGRVRDEIWKALRDKYDYIPMFLCGFCDYYIHDCPRCPLVWAEPVEEECNNYEDSYLNPCSRNFFKWAYWKNYDDKKKIHWATKMLAEIEATPEHEKGREG